MKRYHYEDARFVQALTGLTDEVGVRVATYVYDPAGKVAEETKAGGTERVTFSYSGANTQITDYAANGTGTVRAFSFNLAGGIARATNLTSPCPLCGNTAASTTYGDGGTATGGAGALGQPFKTIGHDRLVTFYQYDAAGRETEKAEYPNAYAYDAVRPALSAATRVTSTKWHATWKLPTQVAEPGKVTAYTYDAKGNPTGQSWTATTDASGAAKFAAIKIGSTFATGWAYNTSGLNTSVIEKTGATETGRWTVTYNAAGDTATVNDATNKRTARMTQYDVHGRMLVGTNDVGVPISFTYSSRGLAASKSVSGQNGVFITNAVGNLTRVTMPDGQTLDYTLDQNQKLIDFKLNGVSVTPQMLAQADYPDTQFKARVASVKRTVQSAIESLMSEALAQVIVPGTRAIKPPVFDPATDMLMSPMSDADRRMRELLQAIAKMCECDPTKGYPKPTLTRQSFAHVHQGDMFHFCGRIKVTSPRE